ncbi:PRC-barrel [Ruegeria sp. TM1040]|uniref:PRC-barrel domain-containing protein n=1 Tax=Ruegeria sp. (strain TM1040) TaxID=292414 RepID=UPI000046295D|nr:PRC-barrel domain-containing protein [Ruegeria sp. TM1040]ABF65429.1 PRC-barrel [Ruegeria sp. TM1040]
MKTLLMSTALMAATSTVAVAETPKFMASADPLAIQASEFIGQQIYTTPSEVDAEGYEGLQQEWQKIGEVNDIVLSRDGNIQSVLVDIGGFLGIGERQIAVDMNVLQMVPDSATPEDSTDYFLVMQADVAEFETAPAYEHSGMSDFSDRAEQAVKTTSAALKNTADDLGNTAQGVAERVGEAISNTMDDVKEITAEVTSDWQDKGYEPIEGANLSAERLTGTPAYGIKDDWIGEVSDLVMSESGDISHAIIDVGGFLGIGETPVKLELSQVTVLQEVGGDALRVYVPMSSDKLKGIGAYES